MNSSNNKKIILCDLGGVLIELNWYDKMRALFPQLQLKEEILNMWLGLKSVKYYESGKCGFDEFYELFIKETKLDINFDTFKKDFCSIIGELKPNCLEILQQLKAYGTLAMLSNTNSIHIETLRERTCLFDHFEHLFFSYEMGMVKPDIAIYKEIIRRLDVNADAIFFFDDNLQNVQSAYQAGINAFVVTDPQRIITIMSDMV